MIAGQRYLGSNVDIWSCGVIMFALICGYLPFEDPNTANLYQKILRGEFQIPKFVSKEAGDLLKNILNTVPESRYTVEDIRKHKWFNLVPIQEKDMMASKGLIIGKNAIPVNRKVLNMLDEEFGFKRDHAKKCLIANKHNHVTTTYYLLYQKYERQGLLHKEDELDLLSEEDTTIVSKEIPQHHSTAAPPSSAKNTLSQT